MNTRDFFENKMQGLMMLIGARLPQDVTFAFVLEGESGGSWQVQRKEGEFTIGPIDTKPKDCELHCTEDVFLQILSGTLNPRRAWLDGRLNLVGDIGLAIRLQEALVA